MFKINSCKLIIELVDSETGEIINQEATLGDFKEVTKKATTSRTKKPKDTDTEPKIYLEEGKWRLNNKAVELTGFEPEMKLEIKFNKKGRITTPILCEDEKSGNRLTKTYTVSCRGSKHDTLAEYGTVFDVIPSEEREGCFELKGNAPQKEDDIVDVPEDIVDFDESDEIDFDLSDF